MIIAIVLIDVSSDSVTFSQQTKSLLFGWGVRGGEGGQRSSKGWGGQRSSKGAGGGGQRSSKEGAGGGGQRSSKRRGEGEKVQ